MTQTKPTTQYTITAAHRISGRSRTTIQKHLKKGKLSYVEDNDGIKRIDASELVRVYGDDCDFSREDPNTTKPSKREEGAPTTTDHELPRVRLQLNTLQEERRREREQLQAQINQLQESLRLAQEGHNRATLLLENRGSDAGWREAISELESRVERQARQAKEEGRRAARDELKALPWWRVVWP